MLQDVLDLLRIIDFCQKKIPITVKNKVDWVKRIKKINFFFLAAGANKQNIGSTK